MSNKRKENTLVLIIGTAVASTIVTALILFALFFAYQSGFSGSEVAVEASPQVDTESEGLYDISISDPSNSLDGIINQKYVEAAIIDPTQYLEYTGADISYSKSERFLYVALYASPDALESTKVNSSEKDDYGVRQRYHIHRSLELRGEGIKNRVTGHIIGSDSVKVDKFILDVVEKGTDDVYIRVDDGSIDYSYLD